MKVFMLGWEFPPYISGGLGTACQGLTRGLCDVGVDVVFVLPQTIPVSSSGSMQFRSPGDLLDIQPQQARKALESPEAREELTRLPESLRIRRLAALLQPYGTQETYEKVIQEIIAHPEIYKSFLPALSSATRKQQHQSHIPVGSISGGTPGQYQGDLIGAVNQYAGMAQDLSRREDFDVIHAHDWMTYPAGIAVAMATGKPLIVHVHSTEFDRSGENVNQQVYDIERAGMHAASRVVAVSHLTRNIIVSRYGVAPENVEVVYNAVETPNGDSFPMTPIRHNEKIVLFLGRVTMQKGPDYFLQAAKKVVEKFTAVRFVIAGSGDMITSMIRLAADLKIGRYVTFTGFLRGDDVNKIFRMADLYVMPSVSEPFGIAPLEAMSHNVPVIISKQSGVSEVLTHALKVDFWDIDEMANKILAVLKHPPLQRTLRQHGQFELKKLSWRDSAAQLAQIYASVKSKVAKE